MRKKIILAGAVSCLLISSVHAAVDKPEGWYLKGSYENLFSTSNYHNLSAAGLAFGYKKDFLRGEAQLSYARVEQKLCGFTGCMLINKGNNFNYGLHGFLDWDNATIISPYVGLGLEKSSFTSLYGAYGSNYGKGVHAVGLVGARAYLTSNVALDVGYKTNLAHMARGGAGSLGLAYHFD